MSFRNSLQKYQKNVSDGKKHINTSGKRTISEIIRSRLIYVTLLVLVIGIVAVVVMLSTLAEQETKKVLKMNVSDVKSDIIDASDNNLLSIAETVAISLNTRERSLNEPLYVRLAKNDLISSGYTSSEVNDLYKEDPLTFQLKYLSVKNKLSEINFIDTNGIILASTNPNYVGFDMKSGNQAAEFLCILKGEHSYVQSYRPITYNSDVSMKYAAVELSEGGMVQVGYDFEQFHDDITSAIQNAALNRHVSRTGYILIIDELGEVISSPLKDLNGHRLSDFGVSTDDLKNKSTEEIFKSEINGEMNNCLGTDIEGYYIFAVVPEEETLQFARTSIIITTVFMALILATVVRIVYSMLKTLVVDSVSSIANSLDKITEGDLEVVVDTRGSAEFDSLSDNINTTVSALREMAAAEAARIETELEYAKNIQRSALPNIFPDRKEFEIFATMCPAKEVGGDFFDFEQIGEDRLVICVADVSGKGIPAALFMMQAKTLIHDYVLAGHEVNQVLGEVNEELCRNNDANMFVTCWFGILDLKTGVFEYADAGHNPPLVRHGNGSYEYLIPEKRGFVLAGINGVRYIKNTFILQPDDRFFLYTDGVTEATNLQGELFGEDRLQSALSLFADVSCKDQCRLIREKIDEFVGAAPQFDDITMLSLRYTGFAAE